MTSVQGASLCRTFFDDRSALEIMAPGLSATQTFGARALLRVSSLGKLMKAYDRVRSGAIEGDNFFDKFAKALDVKVAYDANSLAGIPKTGPLVVTSNHPYGGLDGIVLMSLILRVRPDVKILSTDFMNRVPEIQDSIIPVNFSKTSEGRAAREKALRDAREHVRAGGAIVLFPAGGVSQAPLHNLTKPIDAPWKPGAARMLMETGATSVSVRFPGGNGILFQALGRVPGVRPSFLGREIINKAGTTVEVRIGEPTTKNWQEDFPNRSALTDFLRAQTDSLP